MKYNLEEAEKYMSSKISTEDKQYLSRVDINKFIQEITPKIKRHLK